MNVPIIQQIQEKLWTTDLSPLASAEMSLLILGWAKLSAEEKIPSHLRITSRLIENPKLVEAAVVELGQLDTGRFRVFSEAQQLIAGKVALLLPALQMALELIDTGLAGDSIGPRYGVLLADLATWMETSNWLDIQIAELMFELAAIGPSHSVYLPWDSLGQFAARTVTADASAFVETPFRSLIPEAVALSCAKPFDVKFSDPIRSPSFVEKGKPIKFKRAVCFPPFNYRYDTAVAQTDWFSRFPEVTGVGAVLIVRHLLWQTIERIVVAVPNNVLFSTGVEQDLREDLLRRGVIEAVIAMRSGLLAETNIPFSILVLDPRGGHRQIRFVRGDADRFVESESKARFSLKNHRELVEVIRSDKDTPDARTISVDEIGSGAQLQPNRYVLPEGTRRLLEVVSAAQTVTLGELVQTIRPMNTKLGKGEPIEVCEIGAADLPPFGYIRQPGRTLQMDSYVSAMSEDQFLQENDVVLIVKGSVGKVGIVPDDAPGPGKGGWVAGQSCIILRVKDQAKVDAKTLAVQLRSEMGQSLLKNIVSGATIPLIQLRELLAMPILLPSIEEQRRASQTLEEEDRVQQQINKLRRRQSRLASGLWSISSDDQHSAPGQAKKLLVNDPEKNLDNDKPGRHFRNDDE